MLKPENYDSATRLDSFTTDLTLDNGQLTLDGMQGDLFTPVVNR